MTRREIKNVTASIRQRLLNEARTSGRPFNELLQYFAMERFLYRLASSTYAEKFVLKGALILAAWKDFPSRPTKDIDLLGRVPNDIDGIAGIVRDICRQEVEPDGLAFDSSSVTGERIAEEAEYVGVRVRFRGYLGTATIAMQIDVGFGDTVVPEPVMTKYPTILELPAPQILGYTRETVVAEKFHAMVRRGLLNSRIRDFFDVWALSRHFDFNGKGLAEAISETFSKRDTEVPAHPVAFAQEFAQDGAKIAQWKGLLRKSRLEGAPHEFSEVVVTIDIFLGPLAKALAGESKLPGAWKAPGPWIW